MTRTSNDEYDDSGRLINGFDSKKQAWVLNGVYMRCGHPDDMGCHCYGKEHEGEKTIAKHCSVHGYRIPDRHHTTDEHLEQLQV